MVECSTHISNCWHTSAVCVMWMGGGRRRGAECVDVQEYNVCECSARVYINAHVVGVYDVYISVVGGACDVYVCMCIYQCVDVVADMCNYTEVRMIMSDYVCATAVFGCICTLGMVAGLGESAFL